MHLILRPLVDFSEILRDRKLLAVGVGPDGQVAALAGEEFPGEPTPPDKPSFPIGPNAPSTFVTGAIIWEGEAAAFRELPLDRVRIQYPIVQPLPDGGVLVAGSRVAAGEEPNALVFDSVGRLRRRIMFGDGIEHVQVDRDGKAWVGYFDEGIFGNFGWGEPGGPECVGSSGLNRFDLSSGEVDWAFEPVPGADSIADCYALNVADDAVWVYYYTDFDLTRIDRDGSMRRWKTGWSGARAIAVDSTSALLIGAYGEPVSASLRRFSEDELTDPRQVALDRSDGRLPAGQLMVRGDSLYAADGAHWFVASISDIAGTGLSHPGELLERVADEPAWVDHVRERHT
jgi:hypothetical protein